MVHYVLVKAFFRYFDGTSCDKGALNVAVESLIGESGSRAFS
jgi:hypothetical protein